MMYDPLELPPPAKVVIPRIRNGDIIFGNMGSADEERARLLGLTATLIAEGKNPQVFYHLYKELGDGYASLEAEYVRNLYVEKLEEIMQLLIDYDYETFMSILEGVEAQSVAERNALTLFKSFLDQEV